jgi:hypothetical protein
VSSHLHLKDNCSHVISEIHPQGSNQLRLLHKKKTTKGSKEATVKRGKPPLIENMVLMLLMLFSFEDNFYWYDDKMFWTTNTHLDRMFWTTWI